MATLLMENSAVRETSSLLMVTNILDSFLKVREMAWEDSFLPMVLSMKEASEMAKSITMLRLLTLKALLAAHLLSMVQSILRLVFLKELVIMESLQMACQLA